MLMIHIVHMFPSFLKCSATVRCVWSCLRWTNNVTFLCLSWLSVYFRRPNIKHICHLMMLHNPNRIQTGKLVLFQQLWCNTTLHPTSQDQLYRASFTDLEKAVLTEDRNKFAVDVFTQLVTFYIIVRKHHEKTRTLEIYLFNSWKPDCCPRTTRNVSMTLKTVL